MSKTYKKSDAPKPELKWRELLESAINTPGELEKSFSMFHNYSFGNMMAAWFQCKTRGIEMGPIKTFNGWKDLGRSVKGGEKALLLCQPISVKDKNDPDSFVTFFSWKPRWFALSQTEGEEFDWSAASPKWNKDKALKALGIDEIPFDFDRFSGNTQGYATRNNEVAINPVAGNPISTLFHEIAHIVLGHTSNTEMVDSDKIEKNEKEVEAESVTMLLLDTLGMEGAEFCRGYIQHWNRETEIGEAMAARIIKATNTILQAGLPEKDATQGQQAE